MYLPNYLITDKILRLTAEIERARGVLGVVKLAPAVERKMMEEARIDRMFDLVVLELPLVKRAEVREVFRSGLGRDEEIQTEEVRKIRNVINGMDFVECLITKELKGDFFGKEFLEIQAIVSEKIVATGDLGVYRKNNVAGGILAIEIPYQMEDLWLWLLRRRGEIYPLLAVAVFLYEVRRIIPFCYANEMVARLWMYYYLGGCDYSMRGLLTFCDWGLVRGEEINSFIESFFEKILIEVVRLRDRVKRVEIEKRMIDSSGRQLPLSVRQILLIEEFQKVGELRMAEMREVLPGVSDDTILREMRDLEIKKMIRKKGKTKGARYSYVV